MSRERDFHFQDNAETYTRTHVAVAKTPQSRNQDALWKRNTSDIHVVVIGKGTMLEEALSQTQASPLRWILNSKARDLGTSEERQFRRRRKSWLNKSMRTWQKRHYWNHVLSMVQNKQTSFTVDQERDAACNQTSRLARSRQWPAPLIKSCSEMRRTLHIGSAQRNCAHI